MAQRGGWPVADAEARLRATVEHLAAIQRPSASAGERAAAEWVRDALAAHGLPARLEEERAHGTYWLPLGLLSAAAAATGLAGGRVRATAVGFVACAGIADEVTGGRQLLRRALPRRTTTNVTAEAGDPGAARTLVILAHHDAAHGGLVFDPRPVQAFARWLPRLHARLDTSPRVMRLVAGGPALSALGAALGRPGLRRAGAVVALGSALAFADIVARPVVPGANDNLSGVAVLVELARALAADPPRGLRVLLVSTGAEESFMEGMRAWLARHGPGLPTTRTRVLCLECVGSPELVALEGEGMLRTRDYDPALREELAACARRAGHPLRRGLRSGMATDALLALRAGYPTATLASIDGLKMVSNYHSPHDTPANLDYGSVRAAVAVCRELVRSLSASPRAAPAPARPPARGCSPRPRSDPPRAG